MPMLPSAPGRRRLAIACVAGASLASLAWPAQASEALAKKHACVACHQAERALVGPSWRDIGARHGPDGRTPEQLADAIRQGGAGRWGPVPMPAQPQVPPADLLALARWILQGGRP